ncbi:hypothetical protein B878_22452 [Vibrio campbellii CAIM 519 = NBRC 15631 = ATCC 25920]|nr:hypothetical protein B878_22452 [Vibrio campbellii CAIM 519 = NBRC 15631 = ATCC 25920]
MGGDPVEYAISAGVVIVCIILSHITGGQGFAPFFTIGLACMSKA